MTAPRRGVAAIVAWGVTAAVAATVALAPVMTGGWCADASTPDASACVTYQRSVLGAESTWWIWGIALVIVAGATVLVARGRLREASAVDDAVRRPDETKG